MSSDHRNFSFDRAIPSVLKVDPGSTVRFETDDDTWTRLAAGVPRDEIGDAFNPVTGPVAMRGARSGDALRIEVLEIELTKAWAVWMPEFGPLGDRTSEVRAMLTPIEGTAFGSPMT